MAASLQSGIAERRAGKTLHLAALALLIVGIGAAPATGQSKRDPAMMLAQNEPSQEEPVGESPASAVTEEPPPQSAPVEDAPAEDIPAGDPEVIDDPPDPDDGTVTQEPENGAACQTITVRVGADTCETLCRQYLACPGQANESLFCVPGPC